MARKSGLGSIQVDIPIGALRFMQQHLEIAKKQDKSITLAAIVRRALADYYHVKPELFDVKDSKRGQE